jgi:hypothetical protein
MPKRWQDEGWHYGPDGTQSPGFVEGTAWQPPDTQDHFDSWGSVHPDDLADCGDCKASREDGVHG